MNGNVILVKMLGTFSLEYNGKPFAVERNSATKVNQLLQLLLYNKSGVSRDNLMNYLLSGEKITNPANGLRAIVFRLRKALLAAGLPEDEFVCISRGNYTFSRKFEVECDAHIFEREAKSALDETNLSKKREKLMEVCQMYTGDFLPMLVGSEWAITIQVYLRKLYSQCVGDLCELLIRDRKYATLLEVSSKAAALHPYDEWQGYQMQALIELDRKKEALRLYDETEKLMFDELGVSVSKHMSAQLEKLGLQMKNNTDLIGTVKENLETAKEDVAGAFFCTYPMFVESYRYLKRVINRTGQSAWLMLCTICDGKGNALEGGDRLEGLAEELRTSITKSIRGGDMFTRYSDNQYLLLLLGITKEDCSLVQSRINQNMQKESRKRYLQYNLSPVNLAADGVADDKELQNLVRGIE